VTSTWAYNPEDPWVVTVGFTIEGSKHEVVWALSLDLLMEAFTSSVEQLHGFGDVVLDVGEAHTFLHLSNGAESTKVKFPSEEIREFLSEVDDQDSPEVIARELDRFLETLEAE
jgi:hypothetical protein